MLHGRCRVLGQRLLSSQAVDGIIPTLDALLLAERQPEELAKLRTAAESVGFFQVHRHGIRTTEYKAAAHQLFRLNQNHKTQFSMDRSPHYRGHSKLYSDVTNGNPDFKESFDYGLEHPLADAVAPYSQLHGANLMPPASEVGHNWESVVDSHLQSCRQLAKIILRALAVSIGLPQESFVSLIEPEPPSLPYAILRMNKYPANAAHETGIGAHCDYGLLTILLQDEEGAGHTGAGHTGAGHTGAGLQVKAATGRHWIDVPPQPDCLVVNIGEMLMLATNDLFLANIHRVINPSASAARHSTAVFIEPRLEATVSRQLVPGHKSPFEPRHDDLEFGTLVWELAGASLPNSEHQRCGDTKSIRCQGCARVVSCSCNRVGHSML